jgi:hypothetical protein
MASKICPCSGETFQPHHKVPNQTVQITSDILPRGQVLLEQFQAIWGCGVLPGASVAFLAVNVHNA